MVNNSLIFMVNPRLTGFADRPSACRDKRFDRGGRAHYIARMAIRDIIVLPDTQLRLVSKPIEKITAEIRALADDMLETMYDAPGIGLAAIQVAQPLRIITMDLSKKEGETDPRVFINPEIVSASEELSVYEEGCLSIPGIYLNLTRPKVVTVTGYDQDGNEVVIEADELLARLFQHELDHLNGVLMLDHLSAEEQDSAWNEFNALKESGKITPARKGATPLD